jgi:TonB family protein
MQCAAVRTALAAFALCTLAAGCAPRPEPIGMHDSFGVAIPDAWPVRAALPPAADGPVTVAYPGGTRLDTAMRGGRYDGRAVTTFADGSVLRYVYRDGEATGPATWRGVSGARRAGRFRGARPDLNAFRMPDYPPLSRKLNESGTVQLVFIVEKDGTITHLAVGRSSDVPRLDNAALEAARSWRYLPAKIDGLPLAMPVSIALPFRLCHEG